MCCDRLEYAPRIRDSDLLSHLDSGLIPSLTLVHKMLSRFKSFVLVCIGLLLLASIFVLHPPMRVYFDPRTHDLFNEDGTSDINVAKKVANGGVIMGKLQNATAK